MQEQEQKVHYITVYFQRLFSSTKGWKDDEFGAYMRLLFEQAETGHIPEDPEEIARLITSYKKNWPRLSKKFKHGEKPGTLQNAFMKEVRDDAVRKIAINKENGAKGGRAKKANAIANGTAVAKRPGKRNDSQPVTSNQEPIEIVVDKVRGPWFEMFRRAAGVHIDDGTLEIEIGKFINKYPNAHPNQSGGLVNTWVSRIGSELVKTPETKNPYNFV